MFGTPDTHYSSTRAGPFQPLVLQVLASNQISGLYLRYWRVLTAVGAQGTREYSAVPADGTAGTRYRNTPSVWFLVPQVLTTLVLGQGHFDSWYFRYSRVVSYFRVWYSRYTRALSPLRRWYFRHSLQQYSAFSVFGTPVTQSRSTHLGPFQQVVLQILAASELSSFWFFMFSSTQSY